MGHFLTAQGEELVRHFRPHPAAWLGSYSRAFLWLAWASVAFWLQTLDPGWGLHAGYGAFVLLVASHGAIRSRLRRTGHVWLLHSMAIALGIVAWVAEGMDIVPAGAGMEGLAILLLGAALTLVSLVVREIKRTRTTTYITTQRTVTHRGLAPRREIVVLHSSVQQVESLEGVLGALLGFGRLRLAHGKRRVKTKTKRREVEHEEDDVLEIRGVPHFDEARRDVNSLIHEVRLGERERQKRLDERRLKDAMVTLSRWTPPRRK